MGGEGREGDWECGGCRNRNYAFRSFCNRCKQPRLLVDTKTPADSKWLPRIGDWICTGEDYANISWEILSVDVMLWRVFQHNEHKVFKGIQDQYYCEDQRRFMERLAANGGFQGRPNKPSGTCYAFWVGGVLRILGGHKFIDEKALHQFLLTCQSQPYLDHNQFTGRIPDAFYKHTFLKEMYIEGNAFRPGVNPIGIHNVQHYVNGQVVIESAGDTLESCSKAQTDSYQEEVAVA
ncbi:unnamed protein product [Camellia sinensis]